MSDLKILFVEDSQEDIKACMSTLNRYRKEKQRAIDIIQVSKYSEARDQLDNSFDGAIVDLRLDADEEGNDVIKEIRSRYRIPVVVMTGTPQDALSGIPYLGVFTKGETGYDELFDIFCATYDTGITKILGGQGYLEQTMDKVFWNSILPHLGEWKKYKEKEKDTEKALLRFVVSHITEIIDDDVERYFIQEMYIFPVISNAPKTGSIVKSKVTNQFHIILSPACDLASHDGSFKTDRILLCNIHSADQILTDAVQKQKDVMILETDNDEVRARSVSSTLLRVSRSQKNNPPPVAPYSGVPPITMVLPSGCANNRNGRMMVGLQSNRWRGLLFGSPTVVSAHGLDGFHSNSDPPVYVPAKNRPPCCAIVFHWP
jgi:CheY-like chemotaxis protein